MSIKSTQTISREDAISRIRDVQELVSSGNYYRLEQMCFEEDGADIVKCCASIPLQDISGYTNRMLGDVMDMSFVRSSMFDNYNVVD